MKKTIKRVAALCLVAALVCSLCGCSYLDALRKKQAYFDEAGNVLWNGNVYKALAYSDPLYPEIDYNTQINVTQEDVPVLLSEIYVLNRLYPSADGKFLEGEGYAYYCREDVYEEITERLQEEFVPEVVCYFYHTYNADSGESEEKSYTLTQEQVEAIELVVTTVEPVSYNDTGLSAEYDYILEICECSADMLLQDCSTELAVYADRYYLKVYTEEDILLFTVPEGCNEIFKKIVNAYETANSWQMEEDLEI